MYLKTGLVFSRINRFSVMSGNVGSLVPCVKEHFLVAIYCPPTGNSAQLFSFLEELLEYLGTSHCPFLLTGDVNIDSLRENASAYELNNILATFGSRNQIMLPTRITLGTASSLDIWVSNLVILKSYPMFSLATYLITCQSSVSQQCYKEHKNEKSPSLVQLIHRLWNSFVPWQSM